MASMFENYENLSSQYIPSNIAKAPINIDAPCKPTIPNKPYEEVNANGELIGYWWNYGDTINLDFNLSGYVTADGNNKYIDILDFIVDKQINIRLFNFRHEQITNMLFNGSNYRDLTYEPIIATPCTNGLFYIYSNETGKYDKVYLPQEYNKDTTYYEGSVSVIFPIDKELSSALVPGVYYCSLTIEGNTSATTIFYENDCTLTVR